MKSSQFRGKLGKFDEKPVGGRIEARPPAPLCASKTKKKPKGNKKKTPQFLQFFFFFFFFFFIILFFQFLFLVSSLACSLGTRANRFYWEANYGKMRSSLFVSLLVRFVCSGSVFRCFVVLLLLFFFVCFLFYRFHRWWRRVRPLKSPRRTTPWPTHPSKILTHHNP